jgi:hypothetical protein
MKGVFKAVLSRQSICWTECGDAWRTSAVFLCNGIARRARALPQGAKGALTQCLGSKGKLDGDRAPSVTKTGAAHFSSSAPLITKRDNTEHPYDAWPRL